MTKKFGYGYYINGAYKYGFKTKERCYGSLRRHTNFRDSMEWKVFKIDGLGYHRIQHWYKITTLV
jgi:hypothetical protein